MKEKPAHGGRLFFLWDIVVAFLDYFNAVDIVTNLAFRFVPKPCNVEMIAIEMQAAINPYSIAVAPRSSSTKRRNIPWTFSSQSARGPVIE